MIVIMGATGMIGSALVKRLMELDVPVRALSRDPEKLRIQIQKSEKSTVEVASADATDPESLRQSFAGASQLFLSMSNSPRQIEMESSVIHSAAEAGIEHIVKISSPVFEKSAPVAVAGWHHEIESILSTSGVSHTVLRPYAFMQNLLRLAPAIAAESVFYGSMGNTSCNFIDCRDIADVAAEVLTNHKKTGQVYTLTGSETFSYPMIARKLTALLDRPVQYINMDPQKLRNDLIAYAHMPSWLADHIVEIQMMSVAIPEKPTDAVQQLLGRKPRTLDAFLDECVDHFR